MVIKFYSILGDDEVWISRHEPWAPQVLEDCKKRGIVVGREGERERGEAVKRECHTCAISLITNESNLSF